MSRTPAFDRRRALQGLGVAGLAVAASGLTACATRPAGPPPPPPAPLNRLAVLPVVMTPPRDRSRSGYVAPVAIYGGVQGGSNNGAVVAGVLVVGLVALAIGANQAQNAKILAQSVTALNLDPAGHLDRELVPLLDQRGLPLERITDARLADDLRQGRGTNALPPGVDALLDVRVQDCGFSSSLRFGYTPHLGVQARLLSPSTGETLEEFNYWADARDGKGDPRFIKTPESLNFKSPELIGQQVPRVREDLDRVFDRVLQVLIDDVQRRVLGQPRLA
jgi:hypothetical protein